MGGGGLGTEVCFLFLNSIILHGETLAASAWNLCLQLGKV